MLCFHCIVNYTPHTMSSLWTLSLFVFLVFLSAKGDCFEATEVKPCEHKLLKDCLGKFVSAFSVNVDPRMTDIEIHCNADMVLARCTASRSKCNGKAVAALSKAILSYLVFDAKLRVCKRNTGVYWKLAQKAAAGSRDGFYEILQILLAKTPRCTRRSDITCLKKYVRLMRTNPNLCVNIPKKYDCLRQCTKTCRAEILQSLLGVFPREADKVLHILCP